MANLYAEMQCWPGRGGRREPTLVGTPTAFLAALPAWLTPRQKADIIIELADAAGEHATSEPDAVREAYNCGARVMGNLKDE